MTYVSFQIKTSMHDTDLGREILNFQQFRSKELFTEYPEKNLSEQSREPTNSAHL